MFTMPFGSTAYSMGSDLTSITLWIKDEQKQTATVSKNKKKLQGNKPQELYRAGKIRVCGKSQKQEKPAARSCSKETYSV